MVRCGEEMRVQEGSGHLLPPCPECERVGAPHPPWEGCPKVLLRGFSYGTRREGRGVSADAAGGAVGVETWGFLFSPLFLELETMHHLESG